MEEAANPERRPWRALRRLFVRSAWRWSVLCLVALSVHCTSIERATRVAIALDADPALRARISHVDLQLYTALSPDAWRMREQERLRTDGAGAWPLQWSFAGSTQEDKRYMLEAQAQDASGKTVAELRAVGEVREHETVRLMLIFDASCKEACAEGHTCRDGECVDARVVVTSDPDAGSEVAPRNLPTGRGQACGTGAAACVNECGEDHGGCDALVSCTLEQGKPRCGKCPDDFEQQSDGSCTGLLRELIVQGGRLEPPFSPAQTEYTLETGLIAKQWTLTPSAADVALVKVNGAVLPAGTPITPLMLGAGSDQLVIEAAAPQGAGRQYRFKLQSQGEELSFVKAPAPTTEAFFGHRIALEGDTMAVSAVSDGSSARGINPPDPPPDGAAKSGAAYVYVRHGSSWDKQAYIKASDTRQDAGFGKTLALQGDTLVVGAWKDQDRGAVYVYERSGDSWTEQVKLLPDEQTGSNFGQSVTLMGDLLIVGAPTYDIEGTDTGVAFIYRRSATDRSWVFERKLSAPTPMGLTWFGSSVQLGGDYLVVGATGEGNGSVASGTAYVFRSDNFEPIDTLKASTISATAFFGERSAIAGDTIAVTAFNNDAGLGSGSVYVYSRKPDGKFKQDAALQASNASAGDQFGTAIALTDDYLLVGAAHESSGLRGINGTVSLPAVENSGAAYLFARIPTGFTQIAHIKANEPAAGAQLGADVAISGTDIMVSAVGDPRSAADSGAVLVFH